MEGREEPEEQGAPTLEEGTLEPCGFLLPRFVSGETRERKGRKEQEAGKRRKRGKGAEPRRDTVIAPSGCGQRRRAERGADRCEQSA